MAWKDNFKEGKEITLATSSKKNVPNANIVISLGFVKDKLLISNCQMSTTIQNLKENPKVCVVGGYFRIRGTAQIFSEGDYFDLSVKKSDGYKVKNAILITVKEVFDLNKVKKVR